MSEDRQRWAETVKAAAPEYGIVANVVVPDRFMRMGAKAWLLEAKQDGRCIWFVMSRSGRMVRTYKHIRSFGNFRPAWIRPKFQVSTAGTREQMERLAQSLNEAVQEKSNA